MTFLRGQTFPNAGQWPFYVKQHLVDQNFPTTKHLRHFQKKIVTGHDKSLALFLHRALELPSLFYLREVWDEWVILKPQRRVMPPFPAYVSVMLASFDPHIDAIRR